MFVPLSIARQPLPIYPYQTQSSYIQMSASHGRGRVISHVTAITGKPGEIAHARYDFTTSEGVVPIHEILHTSDSSLATSTSLLAIRGCNDLDHELAHMAHFPQICSHTAMAAKHAEWRKSSDCFGFSNPPVTHFLFMDKGVFGCLFV